MIKQSLIIFLLLTSSRAWAFPSIFEIIEDNTKLIVSCVEGVEPIAEVGDIQKIATHLDCDAQPIDKYCECINKQFPEKLNESERSILEMELGFFGKDDDIEMLDMLESMMRLQQVLSSYENISSGSNSCFKSDATLAKKDIELSLETVLNNIDRSNEMPLPYLKSSYLDTARDLQRSVKAGERINFDNEGKGDAKFLIELAANIANSKPELLTESFVMSQDILAPGVFLHQEPVGANSIVTWEDSVKAMIVSNKRGAFDGSPLFQSLKDTFDKEEGGEYIPNRSAFFDELVRSVRALGLDNKDIENLKKGVKPEADLVRKRMNSPIFSEAISKVANTMCLNLSTEFLWKAKTEDPTTQLMTVERIRKNASKGSALIKEFSVLNPSDEEDRLKLREMIRLRNNMFEKMVSQFDIYRESNPSKELDDKIKKYINKKKVSMGKLWCQERTIQEELGNFETTVVKEGAEVAPEAITTFNTVQELEEQLLIHELEGTQLDEEIGNLKRRIGRYEQELSHSRTQLQIAEAQLQNAKDSPGTLETELHALRGRVNGFRKNLAHYPALIKKEERRKTELAALLGKSRRDQRRLKKKIRDTVNVAVEDQGGWFDNWTQNTANGHSAAASDVGNVPTTTRPSPTQRQAMDEETRRRVFSDYAVVQNSASGQVTGGGSPVTVKERTYGDERTVSYNTDTKEYSVRTNREEALEHAEVSTRIINVVRDSTEKGVKAGTSEDVLDSISGTMTSLANDVSNSLELSDVGEAEIQNFEESIAEFDKDMSPVLGEMNFTALDEFDPAKSVDEIADSHLAKQLDTINSQGNEVAANLAGSLKETLSPVIPVDQGSTPGSPESFISPEVINKGSTNNSKKALTSNKKASSKGVIKRQSADELARSIFNSRREGRDSEASEEELKVKKADPIKSAEIERLKREIAKEKEANKALDKEIAESKEDREKLKQKTTSKPAVLDRSVPTPSTKPIVSPTPGSGTRTTGGDRKTASVASSRIGSAASSSAAVNAVVDGRVKGGVIVNGEFIPQALLSNQAVKSVQEVPNSDLILSSNSTYNMSPITSKNKMAGIPVVKSDKFSKLSPEEKEIFIQNQFTRLKAEQILIEVEDGTNLLVKSTVKLRTRIKVSGLNKLLEKANE